MEGSEIEAGVRRFKARAARAASIKVSSVDPWIWMRNVVASVGGAAWLEMAMLVRVGPRESCQCGSRVVQSQRSAVGRLVAVQSMSDAASAWDQFLAVQERRGWKEVVSERV